MKNKYTTAYWIKNETKEQKMNDFFEGDTTNWRYELFSVTQVFDGTIPTYHIIYLPERYTEAIFSKTEMSIQKNFENLNI